MRKKTKKSFNGGITLVALVVTIIVLIILAGVSINLILGDNGIIQKAKQAKIETEQAKENEEIATNELMEQWETLTGKYAPYDMPYIPVGFTHIGTEDWNSGYQIKETATGNIFVWVPCVLDQSKVKDGDNVQTFKKTLPSTTANTDLYYMYNKHNFTITGDETPAEAIRASVGTYGGFYIAAYEAGVPLAENGTEIEPASATTSQKARSVKDAKVWTNITRTNAIKAAKNMITTTDEVKSGLISGECWDTTLQWMAHSSINAGNEPNLEYDIDSTGNGYYGQTTKSTTGKYPINNIYDMAGNVWEWTTESCKRIDGNNLIFRGGYYGDSGLDQSAACRNNLDDVTKSVVGFRVVLYK